MPALKRRLSEFPFGQRPKTRSRRRQRRMRGEKTLISQKDRVEIKVSEILRGYCLTQRFGLHLTYAQIDLFYDICRLQKIYTGIDRFEKDEGHVTLISRHEILRFDINMPPLNAFAQFRKTGEMPLTVYNQLYNGPSKKALPLP